MYYLVAYLSNPTTSALRVLKRVFGKEFGESVLPVVSSPFGSIGDAQVRLHELLEYVSFGSDQAILVQPEENKIELGADPAWAKNDRGNGTDRGALRGLSLAIEQAA